MKDLTSYPKIEIINLKKEAALTLVFCSIYALLFFIIYSNGLSNKFISLFPDQLVLSLERLPSIKEPTDFLITQKNTERANLVHKIYIVSWLLFAVFSVFFYSWLTKSFLSHHKKTSFYAEKIDSNKIATRLALKRLDTMKSITIAVLTACVIWCVWQVTIGDFEDKFSLFGNQVHRRDIDLFRLPIVFIAFLFFSAHLVYEFLSHSIIKYGLKED